MHFIYNKKEEKALTVSSKRKSVVPLPVGIATPSSDFGVSVTLTESTILPASSCQAAQLTMLVNSLAEPVDSGVSTNDLMLGVNHDHLIELVHGVLAHPVRVQHTKATTVSASTLLYGNSGQCLLVYSVTVTLMHVGV